MQSTIDGNTNTSQKVNSASLDSSCVAADAYVKNQLALTDPEDKAYFLEYMAEEVGLSPDQNLECLRQNGLVRPASLLPKNMAPYDVDPTDALLLTPVDSAKLNRTMYNFIQSFSTYLHSTTPTQSQADNLQSYLEKGFVLQDYTGTIQSGLTSDDMKSLVAKLQRQGYYHAGCFGLLDLTTASQVDGATAGFLVMRAAENATSAPVDSVAAVRVLSGGTKFRQFNIAVDRPLILKLAGPGNVCGTFTVTGINPSANPQASATTTAAK